jgi:hypothetical protein
MERSILAAVQVPNMNGIVPTGAGEVPAVGRKAYREHRVLVPDEDRSSSDDCLEIPNSSGPVIRRRREVPPVSGEDYLVDSPGVPSNDSMLFRI